MASDEPSQTRARAHDGPLRSPCQRRQQLQEENCSDRADAGEMITQDPAWLLETIDVGGEGYCLHETMRARPDTAILDRLR
jgi:hypothetical protein